jgi:aminopeptidase-like protein
MTSTINNRALADEIDQYLKCLSPITRSITGPGNRQTLRILQEIAPLEVKEYPSGTAVYDWIIPDEWRVRDAWIKDDKGNKLVDSQVNNVHLVSPLFFQRGVPTCMKSRKEPSGLTLSKFLSHYCTASSIT